MSSKPKAPKPTAQELELQRSQRDDINELTRDRNWSLKTLKRNLGGRRGLLGSGSEGGIRSGGSGGQGGASGGGGAAAAGGGGLLSGRTVAGAGGRAGAVRTPSRSTSR